MKTIFDYLIENSSDKIGDPDYIKHHDKEYNFDSKYAKAFIFNVKQDMAYWSKPGETHNDILMGLSDTERTKFKLFRHGTRPIRNVGFLSEPENEKHNKCGRIWVIPNNKSKHRKYDVYIAWWNELSDKEFRHFNDVILEQYNTDFHLKLESYIGIDNNGEFILIEPDGNKIIIDRRDEKRKQDVEILKCIHLASQEEKKEFEPGKVMVTMYKGSRSPEPCQDGCRQDLLQG